MNKEKAKTKGKKEQNCKVIKSTDQNQEDQGNDQVSTIVEIRGITAKTEKIVLGVSNKQFRSHPRYRFYWKSSMLQELVEPISTISGTSWRNQFQN